MTAHEQLASAFLDRHPESAARLLETLPAEQAVEVLSSTEPALAAPVLGRMLPTTAARCAALMAPARTVEILQCLESQEAAAVLRHLERPLRANVLDALGPPRLTAVKLVLSYPANTVGAWMDPAVLALPDDLSTGDARRRLELDPQPARPRLYVLDRAGHVRGAVGSAVLLHTPGRRKLGSVVEPAHALWAREGLVEAQEHDVWERNAEAPVVNRHREFVGVVSYVDLRRAQRQISGEIAGAESEHARERDLTELAELLAVGAGSVWESLARLMRSTRKAP
jgi:magnesium transporter